MPEIDDADALRLNESPEPAGGPELLEDGQEEVFSWTAVDHGLTEDPTALDPESFAPREDDGLACGRPSRSMAP